MSEKEKIIKFDNYQYDPISVEIWNDNYKGPEENNREETWSRLAKSCASIEDNQIKDKIEQEFLNLLFNDKFVPGGRIMANLGINNRKGTTLYNCYVHNPIDIKLKDCDSIDGIYDMLKAQAKTLQSEGGYGINSSWIRPGGSYINGIGARSPGVLKFMELWDKSSEIITQGSTKILGERKKDEKIKLRKGAQMCVLEVWHPDIEEFIVAKQTPGRLTKFNISVGITEGFINSVINDLEWNLKFPDTTYEKYKDEWFGDIEDWEVKNYPVIVYKTIKARDLWNKIMTSTYNRAEPGVLFLDLANKLNPCWWFDKIKTTNPCGEIPMSTGICNLGSLNLPMFIKYNKNEIEFDFDAFKSSIYYAIRFLDNINDISTTPLPEYDQSVKEKRRIGLGVMGLGSLHVMLGIRYGSEKSKQFIEKLFKVKSETELLSSAKLGKEKGSFIKFNKDKYFSSYWWNNLNISDDVKKQILNIGEMRNSHQSMNAPTGNTGIYARNVSGGIEPVFGEGYYRWSIVPESRRAELTNQGFEFPDVGIGEWFETNHVKFSKRGDEEILKGKFNDRNYEIDKNRGLVVETFIEDYGVKFAKNFYEQKYKEMKKQGLFATAQELTTTEHLDVLKICAHFTNMSISKTINVSNDYSYDDFKQIYLEAWKSNIKGVTTYREGTMTVVLETKENNKKENKTKSNNNTVQEHHAPKRPEKLACDIYNMQVKGEKWTFFVGLLGNKPYEVFAGRSKHIQLPKSRKTGYIKKNGTYNLYTGEGDNELIIEDLATVFENSTESAFTRTVSLALRHGTPIQYLVEQLEKGADKENEMFSLSKGLMRVLKNYIKDGTKHTAKKCPNCQTENSLIYQESCLLCTSCGFSKCS